MSAAHTLLVQSVEAVLFSADTPVSVDEICSAVEAPKYAVEEALEKLGARLQFNSALQLVRIAGGYQLCTKPQYATPVTRYLRPQRQKLSRSLMEVLAIVAYQQPVTMAEVDAIRGVQSDYSLRQLAERRLIREVGRKNTPGRPILYGTTQQFLHLFNLEDLSQLPDVRIRSILKTVEGKGHEEQPPLL